MHYPHEREEQKQLFSALVEDSQKNFIPFLHAIFVVGFFSCAAALTSSLIAHTQPPTSAWSWLSFWILSIFLILLIVFYLPKITLLGHRRNLVGVKRGFIIKVTLPPLVYSSILGSIVALHLPERLFLTAVIWSGGYAISLLAILPFNLPAIKNLALAIVSLSLGIALVSLRHSPEILPHHLANITILLAISIPCISFSLFFLVLKRP
jgi:hypothetical protein